MRPSESDCLEQAMDRLDAIAPNVPLLALGQTVLWDEPMKVGLISRLAALGKTRRFIAGVHDTDYFAKLASEKKSGKAFAAFPHNDTSTADIWSAAGEFNALFGSETVIRRSELQRFGARIARVQAAKPHYLDEATEAYGWRGVVSLSDNPPITGEVPLESVVPSLRATLTWAVERTLEALTNGGRKAAEAKAAELLAAFDAAASIPCQSLADFYERLAPAVATFVLGYQPEMETTRTSEILKFNSMTAGRARFELVQLFLDPETRSVAEKAYNSALKGSEIYGLDRFGTGALPFDLVIPGVGRGTLRVGNRGIVIMTPTPQFITLKQPVWTVGELAAAVERKFGPNCVLIGKAVTLIGMLSRDFVFVFHEGASSYVKHTVAFHKNLEAAGLGLAWNPILRVNYGTWDTIGESCVWLKLPTPMQVPFGAEEVCSPSFASRWRQVGEDQKALLEKLSGLKRPVDLISFINQYRGGAWNQMATEYAEQLRLIQSHLGELESIRQSRLDAYRRLRELKRLRVAKEQESGDHFRQFIFEKESSQENIVIRTRLQDELAAIQSKMDETRLEIRRLLRQQSDIARAPEVRRAHEQRQNIELEAELKRIKMIRDATVSSAGLARSARRPSAWWFPLVSPDGRWFQETWRTARFSLEELSGREANPSLAPTHPVRV